MFSAMLQYYICNKWPYFSLCGVSCQNSLVNSYPCVSVANLCCCRCEEFCSEHFTSEWLAFSCHLFVTPGTALSPTIRFFMIIYSVQCSLWRTRQSWELELIADVITNIHNRLAWALWQSFKKHNKCLFSKARKWMRSSQLHPLMFWQYDTNIKANIWPGNSCLFVSGKQLKELFPGHVLAFTFVLFCIF